MPNTYGIRKHPCFCLRGKSESRKNSTSTAKNDVE
jgi:ABC-type multidrug transport system ATPase subunit